MNSREKAQAKLERRVKEYERTKSRQDNNSFRPNATGGLHAIHRPGSMNRRKQG